MQPDTAGLEPCRIYSLMKGTERQRDARMLRSVRKIHRTTGIFLFVFFAIVAITGILLGWKKHSGDILLPQSRKGSSTELHNWLPLDSLANIAGRVLHDKVDAELSLKLDRIDVRQSKGMVKIVYADHYWGVQLDGATGELLNVGHRRSDLIENIHDGSVIDHYLGTRGWIKLFYTTTMGLALLTFTITGFWLWYGPKRMRRKSNDE